MCGTNNRSKIKSPTFIAINFIIAVLVKAAIPITAVVLFFIVLLYPAFCILLQTYLYDELRQPADTHADDDYVLSHQRLCMFDVLVCPLSVTERFLLQPLVCGTVFHHMSLLPPSLSIFCCRLKSHLFSLFYPALLIFSHLYSARAVPATRHFGHCNLSYIKR